MNKDPSTYLPEAVGLAAETADRLGHDAKDAAAEVARRAQIELNRLQVELTRVAAKSERIAKENPWATAGTMLGVGVLLGAVGYKLFAPKPTLSEVLGMNRLPDAARVQLKRQMKAIKKYF